MIQQFIGRKEEMAFLEERYRSPESEFIVIYGRRRIGKSELIRKFSEDRAHLYFQCETSENRVLIGEFQARVATVLGNETFGRLGLSGWYETFEELLKILPAQRVEREGDGSEDEGVRRSTEGSAGESAGGSTGGSADGKFIITLDEFPYLADTDPSNTSVFQRIWDELLSRSSVPVMLILCGSSISMMEREVLSSKSPLFGRRTGQIFLRALEPFEIGPFVKDYSFEDVVRTYAVCDGIPAYLQKFDGSLSFEENLRRRVFSKNEYLYSEGEFLVKSEFREYRKYFILLSLLARGKRDFNGLRVSSGLDRGLVSKYLANLQTLHLIESDVPITIPRGKSASGRRTRFRIADHFLIFWFRFVFSNRHLLEEYGNMEPETIGDDLNIYMGTVFESVCRRYVRKNYSREYTHIGSWWNRSGDEIDVVALDEKRAGALLGECKWTGRTVGKKEFDVLINRRKIMELETGPLKARYILFSKSGFTKGLIEDAATRNDLELVGIEEMEKMLQK